MDRPGAAAVATEQLRAYAEFLRKCYQELQTYIDTLDQGRLPLDSWGVYEFVAVQTDSKRPYSRSAAVGEAPPELRRFKDAYYNAHDATVRRLTDLQRAYWETIIALENIAVSYEATETENWHVMRRFLE